MTGRSLGGDNNIHHLKLKKPFVWKFCCNSRIFCKSESANVTFDDFLCIKPGHVHDQQMLANSVGRRKSVVCSKVGLTFRPTILLSLISLTITVNSYKTAAVNFFEGIRHAPLHTVLRGASRDVRLLLRTHISHHQTSEQGCRWSCRS